VVLRARKGLVGNGGENEKKHSRSDPNTLKKKGKSKTRVKKKG